MNTLLFRSLSNLLLFRHVMHRHEPPITSSPVEILYHDTERGFLVVDKPSGMVCDRTLPLRRRII
jgi:23S rRNA-/tRNA-specific pseudouridylate synthase